MAKGKGKSSGKGRASEIHFGSDGTTGVNSGNTRQGGHPVPIKGAEGGGKSMPGDDPFSGPKPYAP